MENYLIRYLNKRMEEEDEKVPFARRQGPVITISRECGCGGRQISFRLAEELSKLNTFRKWHVISKEILIKSAEELSVSPEKVRRLLSLGGTSSFDEILSAFTEKYYKNSKTIVKRVRNVIWNFAADGHGIILGRAGNIITGDIPDSLHVRLIAPLAWRVRRVAEKSDCTSREALRLIEETERERDNFKSLFMNTREMEDDYYDLSIDVSRFTDNALINLLINAYELKRKQHNPGAQVQFFG